MLVGFIDQQYYESAFKMGDLRHWMMDVEGGSYDKTV